MRLYFQENIVQINFSFSIVRAVQNSKSSNNSDVIDVYCNMDIDGGRWMVCRCKTQFIQ